MRRIQASFFDVAGFPSVIGCIDCTHIRILAPKNKIERDYVNRKCFHSINVQAIVDDRGKFLNIVAKWPGCTHDAFILKNSDVYRAFEENEIQGVLLGDSGYPSKKWLYTPLSNPQTRAEKRLNTLLPHIVSYLNILLDIILRIAALVSWWNKYLGYVRDGFILFMVSSGLS